MESYHNSIYNQRHHICSYPRTTKCNHSGNLEVGKNPNMESTHNFNYNHIKRCNQMAAQYTESSLDDFEAQYNSPLEELQYQNETMRRESDELKKIISKQNNLISTVRQKYSDFLK